VDDLIKRLNKVESGRPGSLRVSTCWYRNPDGPEAAQVIVTLRAQLAASEARIADLTADANIVDRMRDRLSDLEGFEDGGITSAMWDELCALRRWLG
jgi:hypothetical protein